MNPYFCIDNRHNKYYMDYDEKNQILNLRNAYERHTGLLVPELHYKKVITFLDNKKFSTLDPTIYLKLPEYNYENWISLVEPGINCQVVKNFFNDKELLVPNTPECNKYYTAYNYTITKDSEDIYLGDYKTLIALPEMPITAVLKDIQAEGETTGSPLCYRGRKACSGRAVYLSEGLVLGSVLVNKYSDETNSSFLGFGGNVFNFLLDDGSLVQSNNCYSGHLVRFVKPNCSYVSEELVKMYDEKTKLFDTSINLSGVDYNLEYDWAKKSVILKRIGVYANQSIETSFLGYVELIKIRELSITRFMYIASIFNK